MKAPGTARADALGELSATPSGTLRALADRCEVEETSRQLDDAIHDVICLMLNSSYGTPPHYTSSLDAAVTLVPEGFRWCVRSTTACFAEVGPSDGRDDESTQAKTPAMALCAAALCALAHGEAK